MRSDTTPTLLGMAPGSLPRPPSRPPMEPIIIRTPPRPREDLEIERPDDMDEDKSSEIRPPPPCVPDQLPPAPPEERAIRSQQCFSRFRPPVNCARP